MYSISNIRLFFRVAFWPVLGPSLGADSAALPADTNMSSWNHQMTRRGRRAVAVLILLTPGFTSKIGDGSTPIVYLYWKPILHNKNIFSLTYHWGWFVAIKMVSNWGWLGLVGSHPAIQNWGDEHPAIHAAIGGWILSGRVDGCFWYPLVI